MTLIELLHSSRPLAIIASHRHPPPRRRLHPMKNSFTFEAEPFEVESGTTQAETGPGEARIVDRTASTPRNKRKATRDIKKVYALVLHQMAFSRGSNPTRYD